MKALILAAGFGTRLLPFTKTTPKALFPVAGRPLLHIIILKLQQAGCKAVIINTHHLHKKIASYLTRQNYTIPVITRYEPQILGTGGAIKNVADFWDDHPFMVINSDILTDIDLKKVYEFHLNHRHPVTLVLHDDPRFNTVSVNKDGFITEFHDSTSLPPPPASDLNASRPGPIERLTFTGIQVLDPQVLERIPENIFSNSIDIYRDLISENKKICAFISKEYYWKDIGSPESYSKAVFEHMAPETFKHVFPSEAPKKIFRTRLKGDGSDRNWYRLTSENRSLVMADHGIRKTQSTSEVDAFVAIGRHLYDNDIPVPEIYLYDTFSGLVFMEDLGDVNLQTLVLNTENPEKIISYYQSVIALLGNLSLSGAKDFDPLWTYQTAHYDQDLILEKECRYFVDAFLRNYLGMNIRFKDLENEFRSLADRALEFSVNGFMHRDMQSRNIMVKNNRFYFIDFQGGRLGPIQYDLAALLMDPYVDLSFWVRKLLLDFSVQTLSSVLNVNPDHFLSGYKYCSITRNLQILGAFAYLSRIKKKSYFEKYIPNAIHTLIYTFSALKNKEFPKLETIVKTLGGAK